MFLEAGNKYLRASLQQHTSNGGGHGGAAAASTAPLLQTLQRLRLQMNPAIRAQFKELGQLRGPYKKA